MILIFIVLLVALAKPIGAWLYGLYAGQNMPGARVLPPVERALCKPFGVYPAREQSWVG